VVLRTGAVQASGASGGRSDFTSLLPSVFISSFSAFFARSLSREPLFLFSGSLMLWFGVAQ